MFLTFFIYEGISEIIYGFALLSPKLDSEIVTLANLK